MEKEHDMEGPTGFLARAFVSCSLREEDQSFVGFVEHILKHFGVEPLGTSRDYPFAPFPFVEGLRTNAPGCDFLVIVATPRYVQWDMVSRASGLGLLDLLEMEDGMPHFLGKPVVLFVKQGTDVKNFLPGVDRFVTLDGTHKDTERQWGHVTGLLGHVLNLVREHERKKHYGSFLKSLGKRLARFKKSK